MSVSTRNAGAVVALGDSITDGASSEVGANHRWPDLLSDRIQDTSRMQEVGVLNLGIAGNRLLWDPNAATEEGEEYGAYFGHSTLRRFDRDVLAQQGVEHVITLIGTNDIGQPDSFAPIEETVTAQEIIDGHRQLIARAHAAGLKIHGGTILPFGGTPNYDTPQNEAMRQTVNEWIRTSGEYDGVVDFDAAVRDPGEPSRMLPAYDSGDHLHPNDAGMQAMADAVPLDLLR